MDPRLLIFDDCRGRFGPLLDLRAVFEWRTGAVATITRVERVLTRPVSALWVRPALAETIAERRGVPVNQPPSEGDWLIVNGRWLGLHAIDQLRSLPRGHMLLQHDGQLIAAHLPHDRVNAVIAGDFDAPSSVTAIRLPAPAAANPLHPPGDGHGAGLALIERPWHILDQLPMALLGDLNAIDHPPRNPTAVSPQLAIIGGHPVKIAADARIMPMVVINAEAGPVVIDRGATINSFALLTGPCYVGVGSTVNAHADIRPNTVIGPACKIGGEVSCSIIHGYTNKGHLGYLGHALVASWVNFGAGSTVSNLKNTYGSIRVQLDKDGPTEDTGRTFLGPIIGDYTLTAIGSRILTGSVIGTGTMLAVSGFAPKHTERFSFHTDEGVERYDIEKFIDMARRMTTRRGRGIRQSEEEILRAVHAMPERKSVPGRVG
jgi:UDP-N-acetylglucosamine diphosphorylase/glucosamine-1-phosphate N-acetyltransferase